MSKFKKKLISDRNKRATKKSKISNQRPAKSENSKNPRQQHARSTLDKKRDNNFTHKSQRDKTKKKNDLKQQHSDKEGYRQYSNTAGLKSISNTPKTNTHNNYSDNSTDDEDFKVHYVLAPQFLEKVKEQNKDTKTTKNLKKQQYFEYRKRKEEILKQKTRKGQPVMAGRMQLIYEKIQKQYANQ